MTAFDWSVVAVGDALPELRLPPLTRHTLALYCGGSGDYIDLHTDIDAARAAGLPDVIGHGMLTMAWMARMITDLVDPRYLRKIEARFRRTTGIGDEIVCSGVVTSREQVGSGLVFAISMAARRAGEDLATGQAEIAVPAP